MNQVLEGLLKDIDQIYRQYKTDYLTHHGLIENYKSETDISWSHWYEISAQAITRLMIRASGFEKTFQGEATKTLDQWMKILISHLSTAEPDYSVFSDDPVKGEKIFFEIVIAMQHNQIAMEQRNKSISEMVEFVRSASPRSQEFILEAITVDPSAIRNITIGKYIDNAVRQGDEKFLAKISKALMKKSPRPRNSEFDRLRMMMTWVAELQGKDNPSLATMEEANDILKLVEESGDTVEAIRHHIKKRRKDRRSS